MYSAQRHLSTYCGLSYFGAPSQFFFLQMLSIAPKKNVSTYLEHSTMCFPFLLQREVLFFLFYLNVHKLYSQFLVCLISGVVILTSIANRFRLHRINGVEQFILAYGGLRGAVAFALVLIVSDRIIPTKNMMVTTIIALVFFTVFIQVRKLPLVCFRRAV